MNRIHSILFMGCSSFGATTMMMSSRWLFLSMGATTRSAAAFAVCPSMIARQQQQQEQQRTMWNALFFPTTVLSASSNKGNENEEVKPTWEYVPFDPKRKPTTPKKPTTIRRNFSSMPAPWTVPKTVSIPEDRLEISFVRSSGSGGQNVNKLSTKVELRLNLNARQSWMPAEVQRRLKEEQANKISKEGILSITAQEHRTQGMNRKSAVDKLRKMVLSAWPRPKIRKQRTGISRAAKARNKDFKKRRSDTKENRKKVDW
jgi:ribosome-associated protein